MGTESYKGSKSYEQLGSIPEATQRVSQSHENLREIVQILWDHYLLTIPEDIKPRLVSLLGEEGFLDPKSFQEQMDPATDFERQIYRAWQYLSQGLTGADKMEAVWRIRNTPSPLEELDRLMMPFRKARSFLEEAVQALNFSSKP